MATISSIIIFASVFFAAAFSGRASATAPPVANILMQIKEISPHFGHFLEQKVFNEGMYNSDTQETVARMYDWIANNQYPGNANFLNALDENDVGFVYELFMRGADIGSTAELPIYENLESSGQSTVLALPVKGEFYVEPCGDIPAATGTTAWKFRAVTLDKSLLKSGASENAAQLEQHRVFSPAPGDMAVVSFPLEATATETATATGVQVLIRHSKEETSSFLNMESASGGVPDGSRVQRLMCVGAARLDIRSEAAEVVYLFAKQNAKDKMAPKARFAVYFARGENEDTYRLAISDSPSPGQYIVDVETYIAQFK